MVNEIPAECPAWAWHACACRQQCAPDPTTLDQPKESQMSEHTLTLHVNGPTTYGDLQVTGFVTARTAREVGAGFADVLRQQFRGADVTVAVHKKQPKEPS